MKLLKITNTNIVKYCQELKISLVLNFQAN